MILNFTIFITTFSTTKSTAKLFPSFANIDGKMSIIAKDIENKE